MDIPIGTAIANVRSHRGLSQGDVAKRMACANSYVSRIENGRGVPQMDQFIRFAEALQISPWKLLRYACRLHRQIEDKL